jgi:hypothetical protein
MQVRTGRPVQLHQFAEADPAGQAGNDRRGTGVEFLLGGQTQNTRLGQPFPGREFRGIEPRLHDIAPGTSVTDGPKVFSDRKLTAPWHGFQIISATGSQKGHAQQSDPEQGPEILPCISM